MYEKFIGIDPGKNGSIAIIAPPYHAVIAVPLEGKDYAIAKMIKVLQPHVNNSIVMIERAQAMPGQGTVSMFSYGRGYGIWLGILTALGMRYQEVHPRVWTKYMLEGAQGEGKERAFHVARKLFPGWLPTLKKEQEHADSLLMAEYARRKCCGEALP